MFDTLYKESLLRAEHKVWILSDLQQSLPENTWCVTHSSVAWGEEEYSYTEASAETLRKLMAKETEPMITCAHYGFSGCNRTHALMDRLLPLPATARIHFYGHSHIGDWVWGKKDTWRRISWVDWHDVPQIDVSSFENIRGEHCRSVFLHIYADGNMGVFFRPRSSPLYGSLFPRARKLFRRLERQADQIRRLKKRRQKLHKIYIAKNLTPTV